MTEYIKRMITIITRGQVIAANALAKEVDTEGGEFTWIVGLSPSGNPPITHYWCGWQMLPSEYDDLYQKLDDAIPGYFQWFELDSWDSGIANPTSEEVLALSNPPLKRIGVD